jgi:hypothetical protein
MLTPLDRSTLTEESQRALTRIRDILGEVCYEHAYVRWGPTETMPSPGIPERIPAL